MRFHFQNVLSFSKCAYIFKMCFHFQNVFTFSKCAFIFKMSLLSKYINCGRVKVWQNTKVVSCISEWHTRLNPPTSTGYYLYCYCFYQYTTTTSQMTNLQWSPLLSKSVFLNLLFRSSQISFLIFCHFWWQSYENTKILRILCLLFARQDGQERKKWKENYATKWPKYQKP